MNRKVIKKPDIRHALRVIFVPTYSETALFLVGVVFAFLFLFDAKLQSTVGQLFNALASPGGRGFFALTPYIYINFSKWPNEKWCKDIIKSFH